MKQKLSSHLSTLNFLLIVLLSTLNSQLSFGAVAQDGTCSTSSTTGATSLTWTHPVSGSNRYLRVAYQGFGGSGGEVTGITYNSVAMNLKQRYYSPSYDPGPGLELYEQVAPGTGSNNVVISNNDTTAYVGSACSFTGVNQATPSGTPVTNNADPLDSGSVTVPANGIADEVGLWGVGAACSATATPQAGGQTKQFQTCANDPGNIQNAFGSIRTTTGSFTWNASDGAITTSMAMPINAAAATTVVRRRAVNQ